MQHGTLTRRRFVVAVAALAGAAAMEPRLFAISQAWAAAAGQVDEVVHRAMLRMARQLFPHDALSDDVYSDILDQALSDTAAGAGFAEQLDAAAAALGKQAGGDWLSLDAAAQVEAMKAIGGDPAFVAIQNTVRAGIYMGAAYWKQVGYPGPSKGFGGYMHRGAGDIDWLPGESS